jgi:hypothetical protein
MSGEQAGEHNMQIAHTAMTCQYLAAEAHSMGSWAMLRHALVGVAVAAGFFALISTRVTAGGDFFDGPPPADYAPPPGAYAPPPAAYAPPPAYYAPPVYYAVPIYVPPPVFAYAYPSYYRGYYGPRRYVGTGYYGWRGYGYGRRGWSGRRW